MKNLFLILVVLGFTPISRAVDAPNNVAEFFRSPENMAIVAQPERVEACILHQGRLWFTRDERKRKYKEGRSAAVPADAIVILSAKFTSNSTYVWNAEKACMPVWNARLKFYRDGHCITADCCFGCDIVVLFRDGQGFSAGNFDHGSNTIFEVVRSLFPRDEVVLSIIEMEKQREETRALAKRLIEEEEKKANQPPIRSNRP